MNRSGAQRLTRRISTYLSRGTRARRHEPAPVFHLEPLEQRLLLDATFIDMTYANAWQVLPLNSAGQYAMFEAIRPGTATGTGLINSCVKMNADSSTGVEQGYNTDASTSGDTVLHDVQKAHSLLLSDLPSVKVAGQWYREFWLDVVESPAYLSLDKLQIFLGDGPALTGYPGFGGHAQKIFDLDTDLAAADPTGGAWMGLQDLNAGSGQGDYRFFIPETLFSGHAGYNYVYLYSKFGGEGVSGQRVQGGGPVANWKADSGGEEWFVFKTGAARGTISGYKFNDLNGNGVDNSEPRLNGWTIELYKENDGNTTFDAGDTFVTSMLTSGLGTYGFIGLQLGSYYVREKPSAEQIAAGWTQKTTNPPLITLHTDDFIDPSTSGYAGLAFGNACYGTISGKKFLDVNADGDLDVGTDSVLEDWWIYAYNDTDGDGLLDATETEAAHQQTDADGLYSFDLQPGKYIIVEENRTGWSQSGPTSDVDGGTQGRTEHGYAITLVSNQEDNDNDFANYRNATISGYKYEDMDADGNLSEDTGQPLAGWEIHLDGTDGLGQTVHLTDTTDALGYYEFSVAPGVYAITEVVQTGWTQSYPDVPGDADHDVTPISGQSLTAKNFGNWTTATVSGVKFEDLNADHVKDTGELGLSGWTIFVDYNDNDAVDTGEPSALTGTGGSYTISGIKPGTWKIKEVLQTGWTQSYPTSGYDEETFTSHAALTGQDFGNWTAASVSGVKFEDLNADHVKDTGELGLSGWTIFVDYNDNDAVDTGEPSALTGTGGSYTITGIKPGTWRIKEVLQTGWTQSYPTSGYYNETFTSHAALTDQDFGNYEEAGFGGVKFEDSDGDGAKDLTESGLENWVIRAYEDLTGNGVLDQTDYDHGVIDSDTTDSGTGAYYLDLEPGRYIIVEVLQTNWHPSAPATDVVGAVLTGGEVLGQNGYAITLVSNQEDNDNDFANYRNATISGYKYEDMDADGSLSEDTGQPLAGWEIHLDGTDGLGQTVHLTDTTDALGYYEFSVAPGVYAITEVVQTGWTQSYPDVPGDADHDVTPISGQSLTAKNFGNWTTATVSGVKFEDLNADHVKDTGELGLSGWTIFVDYNDNDAVDTGEPSALTGTGGSYTISGIKPGTWKVKEVLQAGWTQSYPTSGYDEETFTSHAALTDQDFGNYEEAGFGGVKFLDVNQDGSWDKDGVDNVSGTADDEIPLSGVEIRAYADDGDGHLSALEGAADPVDSDTTDADGDYYLDLDPGSYVIVEVLQSGLVQTCPITVVVDFTTAVLGQYGYGVTLISGQEDEDNNFGNYALPTGTLLPTQTTVQMYASGDWPQMYDAFHYQAKGNEITSVAPGVIFYYDTIVAPSADFHIDVIQWNSADWKPMLAQQSGSRLQAYLYDVDFHVVNTGKRSSSDPYTITFDVKGATAGATYYIGIKYAPTNLKGQMLPNDPTKRWSIYSFETKINDALQLGSRTSISVLP